MLETERLNMTNQEKKKTQRLTWDIILVQRGGTENETTQHG